MVFDLRISQVFSKTATKKNYKRKAKAVTMEVTDKNRVLLSKFC